METMYSNDTNTKKRRVDENVELSILNYNIFFGRLDMDTDDDIYARLDLLCGQIESLDATLVCLQEVTPDRYERIVRNLSKTYPYRFPEKVAQSYDTAIFSKVRIKQHSKIKYSVSQMKRSIMWVVIESPFNSEERIGIATSHLESEFSDNYVEQNVKMIQYSEAEDILDQLTETCNVSSTILCADFNSHNVLSDTTLYKAFKYDESNDESWKDSWIERGSDPQFENTFDSTTNPLMLEMHSTLENPPYYVSRLDRILHHGNLHTHKFEMIVEDTDLISDHYPIKAVFKADPPSDLIQYVEYDSQIDTMQRRNRIRVKRKGKRALSTRLKKVSLFN
jgi:endonuclease/exonuclease/phosphatase family metal-dependent hydrolase